MARLRDHPILAVHPALRRDAARHGLPSLLQRLEWMLYHAAHSLGEYANAESLERRVQALVTHYKRQSAASSSASPSASEAATWPSRRRQRSVTDEHDAPPTATKRQHVPDASAAVDCRIQLSTADGTRGGCSLSHNLDLLRHVFSFLDGREALRCRAVSRFFTRHAPSFVTSLRFEDAAALARADAVGISQLLLQCHNLQLVSIGSRANLANVKAGVVFPRALSQTTAAAANHATTTASVGLQLVRELADAVALGGCRKLEALELHAPFDFANESDAALGLVQALVATDRAATLKRLVLGAVFLGDKGVLELARLMRARRRQFRSLEHLGLRNNFVGEAGCQALLEAVRVCLPRLEALDLRQNILSDVDAVRIADLLDQPAVSSHSHREETTEAAERLAVPRLRSVQLDGNFIGCEGFHAIAIALCARREVVQSGASSCSSCSPRGDLDSVDGAFPDVGDDGEPVF